MSARSLVEAALVTACPLLHPSSTAGPDEYFDFIVDEILLHSPHVESAVMLRNVLGEHLMSVLDPAEVPQVCRRLFLALRALDGVLPQANEENEEEEPESPSLEEEEEEEDEKRKIIGEGSCVMCDREMPLTLHHMIPREVHEWYKNHHGKTKDQLHSGIMVCRDCHSAIHKFEDNKTLAAEYRTLETLMAHPKVQAWIPYIRKQRPTNKADKRTWKQGARDLPPRYEDE